MKFVCEALISKARIPVLFVLVIGLTAGCPMPDTKDNFETSDSGFEESGSGFDESGSDFVDAGS